jgi:hypothetical protein
MAEDPITWSGLKTSARSWMAEISTDSISEDRLEECIAFAERHFSRKIRSAEMEDVVSSSSSGSTITLPSDFLQMRSIYIDRSPINYLKQVGMAELREMFPTTGTGVPTHYALQSGSEVVLRPLPSGSFTYVLNYYKKIPALNATDTTNWLLTDHSDLYLAGTLFYAYKFLMDEKRALLFKSEMDLFIDELTKQNNRKAWSSAPVGPSRTTTNIPNISA